MLGVNSISRKRTEPELLLGQRGPLMERLNPKQDGSRQPDWLIGGGETGDLIRSLDWSKTPLGPRQAWPQGLRAVVNLVVSSSFPTAILWGEDLIFIYNDAYRVIAGERHPQALGRSTRDVWPEVWEFNKPIFKKVMARGETIHLEDQLFRIARRGQMEDAFFTLSYSPIRTEDGQVGGTLVTLMETTRRLMAERRADAVAEERARMLDALMEHVPAGITVADADGTIRRVSRYGQNVLGGPHEQMSAHAVASQWKVYSPDGVTPLPDDELPLVRAMRRGEVVQDRELVQVNTAGEAIPLLCNAAPIRDAGGEVVGGVVVWRDVSERKRAEESLRRSEEKYRSLFENMSEGFGLHELICDDSGKAVDWRFLEINPAFERLTGLKREQVIGRTHSEVLPGDDPEWLDIYGRVALTGEPAQFENYSPALQRHYEVFAFRPAAGQFATVFIDITQRKQAEEALRESEQRLRLLLAALPVGVHIAEDAQCGVITSNPVAARMFEAAPETNISASAPVPPPNRFYHQGRELTADEMPMQTALREDRGVNDVEIEAHLSSGRRWTVLVNATPVHGPDGQVVGGVATLLDITERKRTEEALRESEARLRRIAQAARVGFFEWNATKDVAYWSPEHYELFGYEPGTPITWERWLRGVHPEDRQRVEQNAQRLMERGRAEGEVRGHTDEYRFVRADGAVVWIESDTSLTTTGGQMIVRGTVRDITARKQAEAMIAQNVRLLNATGEIAKVGGWELDLATHELSWTDEVCRIHGVEPGYRPRLEEAIDFYAPESRPVIADAVRRCMADGEAWDLECRFIPRGRQEPIWVRAQGRGIFGNGKVLKLAGAFQDITERKQAAAALAAAHHQFQSIINNTPDLVYALDLEERFLMANAALAELLHATPDQMLGKRRHEFMPQADAEAHEANDRQVIETGRVLEFEESSQLQGRSITWLTKKFPLRDAEGKIYAVAGITADISRRKQAEAELKAAKVSAEQAKAVAESASKAKDQFIAVLSHELRTPLTPAVAALSLLRSDVRLPADVRDDLEMVSRNIDLEVRLIADLLDVSRIMSGKLHLERRTVDVANAIREAAHIVSGELDAKGQTLTIETPGAPYLAFADAARLQQVFWNLLRNSIKFSPTRSRIAVRAAIVPVDFCPLAAQPCPVGMGDCPLPQAGDGKSRTCGGNLIIEVIDRGSGVAPDMLPRLFNAFEQEEKARSFGGLGLGLSICKAVVEMHGGSISAHSDGPGCGATFTVRLPVAQCPLSAAAGSTGPSRDNATTSSPEGGSRPLRILLVEDHPDTAKLMRRLLMIEGHDVITAESVGEALAAVQKQKPDILISDLGLPDGSGLGLMRQLLAQGHRIPAIALSGFGTAADIEKSKEAGFAEHLTKPLSSVDALTAAIVRLGISNVRDSSH